MRTLCITMSLAALYGRNLWLCRHKSFDRSPSNRTLTDDPIGIGDVYD